jgi:hypothetical protein
MNDEANLYLGLRVERGSFGIHGLEDVLNVVFDNNHSGPGFQEGDDVLQLSRWFFTDSYMTQTPTGVWFTRSDLLGGGSNDGAGRATANGDYQFFEISHPLDSDDDSHDFSLSLPATVGFNFSLTLGWLSDEPCVVIPSCVGRTTFPAGRGDIVLASKPPLFLHRVAGALILNAHAPTASAAQTQDSPSVNFAGGNLWKDIGTWNAGQLSGNLTGLTSLSVWLGLKNSDDQGTQFDLRAEAYRNGDLIAEGLTRCIAGLTRNPALAKEAIVQFGNTPPVALEGDTLTLKLSTRIGTEADDTKCSGPGGSHNNAVGLRVYFDAATRQSRLEAVLEAVP